MKYIIFVWLFVLNNIHFLYICTVINNNSVFDTKKKRVVCKDNK